MSNSIDAYNRSVGKVLVASRARRHRPPAHEPNPKPAMKTDSTIETMAVVTPNSAMERRNHTSSKRTLQKPERKKKKKYQLIVALTPCGSDCRAEQRENDRREHNGAKVDF